MTVEFTLEHFDIFGIYSRFRLVIPGSYDAVFEGKFPDIFIESLGV